MLRHGNIDGFRNIETMWKSTVIGFRKNKDKCFRLLNTFVNWYWVENQFRWINLEWNLLKYSFTKFWVHILIKLFLSLFRDDVPGLVSSFVVVVEGREIHVFSVPAKCWKHHSQINPGICDSGNLFFFCPTNLEQGALLLAENVHIEFVLRIIYFAIFS